MSATVPRKLWKLIRQVNVPNARHDGKRKGSSSNESVPQQDFGSGKEIGEGKEAHRKEEPGNGPGPFRDNEQDSTKPFQKLGSILALSTSWIHRDVKGR